MNCFKVNFIQNNREKMENFKRQHCDTHFDLCISNCPEFCCFSFLQRTLFKKKTDSIMEPKIFEISNNETPIITIDSKVADDEAYVFILFEIILLFFILVIYFLSFQYLMK